MISKRYIKLLIISLFVIALATPLAVEVYAEGEPVFNTKQEIKMRNKIENNNM